MPITLDGTTYPDIELPCNRDNMTVLVEALESGDYQQGHGQLKTTNTDRHGQSVDYCCLGVACDKSGKGHWDSADYYVTPDGTSDAFMPPEVQDWLGVDERDLVVTGADGTGEVLTASSLNDHDGPDPWDFPKIAARLREVYLTG